MNANFSHLVRIALAGAVLCLPAQSFGQATVQTLKSFGFDGAAYPYAGLVQGRDGALYGTTTGGGTYNAGTVFKLSTNGTGYTVLYSFTGTGGDGAGPKGLVQGPDDTLYGMTQYGGDGARDSGNGTVFKLDPDGTGYTVLYRFTRTGGDGYRPYAGLVQGRDGALYGTTSRGGTNGYGTVFKLGTGGMGYTVLHSFTVPAGDGAAFPQAGLVQASDGALYGTIGGGATNAAGTIFKLNTDGTGYAVLYSFPASGRDGASPDVLMQGLDGALYGTTASGGTNDNGVVFKLSTNGTGYTVLYKFTGLSLHPAYPVGLVQGRDGALYGTTYYGGTNIMGAVFKLNTDGTGYTMLYSFTGAAGADGAYPSAGLVQGPDGTLYGTTHSGGTQTAWNPYGYGTVFKLNPNGTSYAVLYSFTGAGADGVHPSARLVQGSDGGLYGTTGGGGASGDGTVFKLSTDGTGYTVLYSFMGIGGAGAAPNGLMQGRDGALYGTTEYSGAETDQNPNGLGTVFKLSTNGTGYTVLHSFAGTDSDGASPSAGLIQGRNGALYGTTWMGGTSNYGTVFQLSTNGTGYKVLHNFTGAEGEGGYPLAGLVQGRDGCLYGTTDSGTVFKLNTDGTGYVVLHTFPDSEGDGFAPEASLVQGRDGALYGTTVVGGIYSDQAPTGYGTIFKLSTDGTRYTVLYRFTGTGLDGYNPFAGLVQGGDAALYGTTSAGGANGRGTVFKLSTDGTGYPVLYSFGAWDGDWSAGGLVQGRDGALYGTTPIGGAWRLGTVFRLTTPPSIITQPQGGSFACGANVSLAVSAQGAPPPAYQWYFGGSPVPGATAADYSLTASALSAGGYTVVVANSDGAVTSSVASIVVVDTTPPVMVCPADLVAEFTSINGAAVTFAPAATDNCLGPVHVTCQPPSGGTFPIGVSPVLCTATDAAGNSAHCQFQVAVLGGRGVLSNVLADLRARRAGLPDPAPGNSKPPSKLRGLDDAIGNLTDALAPALWVDQTHLTPRGGQQVFRDTEQAAHDLQSLLKDKRSPLPDPVVQGLLGRIVKSGWLLAAISVQEAVAAGMNGERLRHAQAELAQGEADAAQERYANAIGHYANAWRHVERVSLAGGVGKDGRMRLRFAGAAGRTYVIEASTNLVDWAPVAVCRPDHDGDVELPTTDAPNYPLRFYRIAEPQ